MTIDEISNELLNSISKNDYTFDNNSINIDTNLIDINIDSLDFINLIVEIEKKYDVEIPTEKLLIEEIGTIGELANLIFLLRDE